MALGITGASHIAKEAEIQQNSCSILQTGPLILLLTALLSDSPKDNIIKRIFATVKFSWILFLALLDSFTNWLNSVSREYIDISTVLRIERCMLTREVRKVRAA